MSGLIRNTSIVTGFSALAQLAGFLRLIIITYVFGATIEVDTYYLALVIPSIITLVFSGWLQLTYVGRYTQLLGESERTAHEFKMTMGLLVLGSAVVITLLCYTFPQILLSLVEHAEQGSVVAAFSSLLWLIVPITLADFMGQTLNGHHRFALAAGAPIVNALVSIAVLTYGAEFGTEILIWSLLAGAVAQLIMVTPSFLALAPLQGQLTLGELRVVGALTLWVVPGIALANLMLGVMQFSIAFFGTGIVTIMAVANRLNAAFNQLTVMGISHVLLPHFANLDAQSDSMSTFLILRRLSRGSAVIGAIMLVGAFLFAEPLINLLFVRGAFTPEDGKTTAFLLCVLCFSFIPFALGTFIARLFTARRDARSVFVSGLLSFTLVCATALLAWSLEEKTLIALAPMAAYCGTAIYWLTKLDDDLSSSLILRDICIGVVRGLTVVMPASLIVGYFGFHTNVGLFVMLVSFITLSALVALVAKVWQWTLVSQINKLEESPSEN